ncbi:MAG: hypothetical protein ABR588_01145 [Sphingomicrobium sp.]
MAGSAGAMSSRAPSSPFCEVVGAAKLPPEVGGADGLCAAVRAAVGPHLSVGKAHVTVRVLSPSLLSATIRTANGTMLSEQKFAVSDARLTPASVGRFARSIADRLGEASRG